MCQFARGTDVRLASAIPRMTPVVQPALTILESVKSNAEKKSPAVFDAPAQDASVNTLAQLHRVVPQHQHPAWFQSWTGPFRSHRVVYG
jgi:hypothetical protein